MKTNAIQRDRRSGSALIIIMYVCLLLAAIGTIGWKLAGTSAIRTRRYANRAQALALALYNQKKNEPAEVADVVESTESLSQVSGASETAKQNSSANIIVQREDDEATILVRILKDGGRCVYQKIDPPKDVIKLIREVANIDLDLPPNPIE